MSPRAKPLIVFAVLAALAGLETCRLGNPEPEPASAPDDQFSATRAIATLHAVLVDQPHPVGSAAHDTVRDGIAAALRALDYTVEVQHAFACNAAATCGTVDNLIARRNGQAAGGKAVVVAAHYDSVPAGPGASDDGTGVASALEIARAIRHDTLANPVVFLIDDAEEAGLVGAEAYIADAERSRDAAFVINLEARGTTGTPYLFETSREQRWLVPIVAHALPHPVTTSLFAAIYDQLPNDTDLTVFKRAERAGINFAYIGGGTQYHTPLDNFADVDAGSVQRRGDQALAMVRAFGAANLGDAAPGGAVWFDVFAAFVVWWPAWATFVIVAVALALLGFAIVRGMRGGRLTLRDTALGVASFVGSLAVAGVLGSVLARLFGLQARAALFAPHPTPKVAAAWLIGIAASIAIAAVVRRRASFDAVFAGHALAWNAVAVALAVILPGAAYLAVVPGFAMAALAAARTRWSLDDLAVSAGALVAAAIVFLPFVLVGYESLGDGSLAITAVMLAFVATTFAPLVSDTARRLAPGCLALAAVLAIIGAVVPRSSDSHPRHASIAYVLDGDAGTARWQVNDPPPGLRAAGAFAERREVLPWIGALGASDVAPAPREPIAVPTAGVASVTSGTSRQITLDVTARREAQRLLIAWHSDAPVTALKINGVTPPPRPARWHRYLAPGWNLITVLGATAHVEITQSGAAPAEAIVIAVSFGLPASGAALARARDADGAVPLQNGDITGVEHRVRW
jgi:peptidase M28-like protein